MTDRKCDDELEDTRPIPDLGPQLGTAAARPGPGSCSAEPGPRDIVYRLELRPPAGHYEPHCYACDALLEPYKGQDIRPGDSTSRLWCPHCYRHPFAIAYRFVRDPEPAEGGKL